MVAPAPEPEAAPRAALPPLDPAARRAIAAGAAPVLEQIAAEVRACRRCGLCETRNQAVPGVGTALSGIAFVGEAPGADEDRLGEPFVGRGGQLLDRIIKAMDDAHLIPGVPLDRRTVFIGNVLHCRPPENRVPLPHEVEQSSPFLHRQLDALQPRIVCCLGKTAGEHLLGVKATLGEHAQPGPPLSRRQADRDLPSRGGAAEPGAQAPGVGGHAVAGARVPDGLTPPPGGASRRPAPAEECP